MGRKGHGRYGKHSRRDRRKKKGGIISTVILIVAICVFAFSAFQLYKIFNGYHKGESEYNDLVKLAVTACSSALNAGLFSSSGPRGHHVCRNSLPLRPKSMRTWPTVPNRLSSSGCGV